jgi:hypothetical protein
LALAPDAATTESAPPALPDITETMQPEFAVPAVPDAIPADPDKLPTAVAPLLLDLLRALTALDTAVQSSQQVDPKLHRQLDEAVEALAAYFELPQAMAKDVALPLAAHLLPTTASAEPAPAGGLPPADPSTVPEPAVAAAPPKAAEAAARPTIAPSPLIARLAERLQSMSEALATTHSELAGRLNAVADRLMSGRDDPQKLAAIGLDAEAVKADTPLAKALELLLRPAPEAKPAAPPPPFTAATLALPPEVAAPRGEKQALQQPSRPEAPAPAAPEAREPEPAPNNRAADRPTAPEAGPPPRNAAANPPPAREPATAEAKPLPATAAATAVAATAAASAKTVHAAYQAPPQQLNLPQVAFEMVRQFQAGNSRFQIRLDPPELGRIDVRMDMDRDGNVMARMTVERSETLDLMQRDQRALERALAQAGLDSARTSLEFSLRHQGSGREQREGGGDPVFRDGNGNAAAEPDTPLPSTITHHRGLASPSGVNLFV